MAISRYLVNGVVATAVHYSVLVTAMELFDARSAGLANLLASIVGITASFLGNRYYVFRATADHVLPQGMAFLVLYGLIAALNGGIMYLWSDVMGYHYNIGFLIALVFQVVLGYSGARYFVFRENS